ncbi:MAG: glycine oxidase ThiO [Nocardioidaceae bacterium]
MRAAVVGAGIVGLACAEELVRAGHDVTVFDPAPATGATYAAAGMLAPGGEAWHGEEPLLRLGLASLALWRGYAGRLGVDYRDAGTVLVGRDRDDLATVTRSADLLAGHGVEVAPLDRAALRDTEPVLTSRAAGGTLLRGDHSVDPRRVAAALQERLGSRLVTSAARPVVSAGRCSGVTTPDRATYPCDVVVVATGHRLDEAVPQRRLVRPVRGEVVRVRTDDPPRHTVRALVHGEPVYLVPRADGTVVVGATSEEHAGAPAATVGGVARLLDAARALVPSLETAELVEVVARHRPGSPDNGPLLGPTGVDGLLLAAGHHRGGVLLAPLTARTVRAHAEGRPVDGTAAEFTPDRFEERTR